METKLSPTAFLGRWRIDGPTMGTWCPSPSYNRDLHSLVRTSPLPQHPLSETEPWVMIFILERVLAETNIRYASTGKNKPGR